MAIEAQEGKTYFLDELPAEALKTLPVIQVYGKPYRGPIETLTMTLEDSHGEVVLKHVLPNCYSGTIRDESDNEYYSLKIPMAR
jgi:hypothetical protein